MTETRFSFKPTSFRVAKNESPPSPRLGRVVGQADVQRRRALRAAHASAAHAKSSSPS